MTLERHRSKLIPDVVLNHSGQVIVTDGEGTFPLSHGKRRERLPSFKDDNENEILDSSDLQSFRSYDPKRERKYKPRESQYEKEVNNISGTLSSGGSRSLQRKLNRHKNKGERKYEADGSPKFGTLNLTGTMSDRGRSRRPKSHPPATPYPGSLNRKKVKQTLNIRTLKKSKQATEEVYSRSSQGYSNGGLDIIPETVSVRNKKFAEEKLPGIFFLIGGLIMLALAIVKLLMSWWTSYWAPLWTSILLICLGIIGILHRGDYFTKWKNAAYIVFGVLSLTAVFVCCGLLLWVVSPMVAQLASSVLAENIAKNINQTNLGRSLVGDLPISSVVSLNVGLDLAIFVLCLVNLYTITATSVAISNHWDAVYDTTGDCDHRGNPRLFNPLEQSILGVVSLVIGLLAMSFTQYEKSVYATPAIAGTAVILAGMASFCFGKRPDRLALAIVSITVELLALLLCAVSTVFLTLALVEDVRKSSAGAAAGEVLSDAAVKASQGQSIAAIIFIALYFLTMVVNVVFASGVLFRVCRKSCCSCIEDHFLLNESRF